MSHLDDLISEVSELLEEKKQPQQKCQKKQEISKNIEENSINDNFKKEDNYNVDESPQQVKQDHLKQQSPNQKQNISDDNIDNLLNDVLKDSSPLKKPQQKMEDKKEFHNLQQQQQQIEQQQCKQDKQIQQQNQNGKKIKCYTVLVSNTSGICNEQPYSNKRICDKLRCTSCDLQVNIFNNYKWSNDCDYLFFRNMFSNKQELQKKLVKDNKFAAYACQCSWINISKTCDINECDKGNQWVCSGHLE